MKIICICKVYDLKYCNIRENTLTECFTGKKIKINNNYELTEFEKNNYYIFESIFVGKRIFDLYKLNQQYGKICKYEMTMEDISVDPYISGSHIKTLLYKDRLYQICGDIKFHDNIETTDYFKKEHINIIENIIKNGEINENEYIKLKNLWNNAGFISFSDYDEKLIKNISHNLN